MNRSLTWLAKGAISIGLIALLLFWIPLAEIRTAFSSMVLPVFMASCALFLLQQTIIAWCWQVVLKAQQYAIPFSRILQVHLIGAFFGTFMPTSIGMDVVRAYSLSRDTRTGADAMSSMFITRVVGFLINFVIALAVAIPVVNRTGNTALFQALLLVTVLFCAGVFVLLHPALLRPLRAVLRPFGLERMAAKIAEFQSSTLAIRHARSAMLQLVFWSLVFQVLGIYIIYLIGVSLGIQVSAVHYFILIPLITAITVLPLSVAGIGVREGAFVFFFGELGVTSAQAFSLSTLVFAQWVGLALMGGIAYGISGIRAEKLALANQSGQGSDA